MTECRISVVIPMKDAATTIGRALASIAQQTVQPFEIVIVDNASTDGSAQLVNSLKLELPVHLLSCATHGSGAARNLGIDHASGTHLAFLDADDVWYPAKLERQIQLIRDGALLVGTYFHYLDESGNILGDSKRLVTGRSAAEALRAARAMPAPISSLLIARSLIDEVGQLDVQFLRAQDFEWLVRLAQRADLVMVPDEILVGYVMSQTSATATAYAEQALAADLVRRRLSAPGQGSYAVDVTDALRRRLPRSIVAGHHYRQAGIAYGQREIRRFASHLLRSMILSPVQTSRKLISQSVATRNPQSNLSQHLFHG